ncbi:hypothetical protein R69927_03141 [Paraburkholderia domus]|jgi:hypothetical protein|uniref:DUF6900 domain-containing protein n=1 Tax=Paraburkholderia domus TaxID=2793075 RepID=A0A9N8MM06_9BURK|nr:hypothetical protein [Paraburkholderia domus]MBK5047319.1 hypothetical protein [Burkholderia sp. R-70006]MBK5059178.1 hypothetical protein [Burkholderia sp. R-70199]MBK5086192.1 hypothetical protein [Burkholderia sp. R-69927]MBK5119272.1 hypothetical protein [Burkholderia sp. R-69980]MBK5163260.1 hypothetical protein [Burkholderia sp. R-70211]MBK5179056.1 hypothetical protein [Burkholderia sp. R-69749]MCI0145338.1 hypothetical protein [Paraburkholderia sediminicola]
MNTTIEHDARLDLLLSIAHEALGITTFELSGKASADLRIVRVDSLARALEAAYDAGLMTGRGFQITAGTGKEAV